MYLYGKQKRRISENSLGSASYLAKNFQKKNIRNKNNIKETKRLEV